MRIAGGEDTLLQIIDPFYLPIFSSFPNSMAIHTYNYKIFMMFFNPAMRTVYCINMAIYTRTLVRYIVVVYFSHATGTSTYTEY